MHQTQKSHPQKPEHNKIKASGFVWVLITLSYILASICFLFVIHLLSVCVCVYVLLPHTYNLFIVCPLDMCVCVCA